MYSTNVKCVNGHWILSNNCRRKYKSAKSCLHFLSSLTMNFFFFYDLSYCYAVSKKKKKSSFYVLLFARPWHGGKKWFILHFILFFLTLNCMVTTKVFSWKSLLSVKFMWEILNNSYLNQTGQKISFDILETVF